MPIIVTTNEESNQGAQKQEVFANHEEAKKAVQTPEAPKDKPKAKEDEKKPEASATEENKPSNNEDDKSFDYLNSNEEDEESDEVLDDEDDESNEEEQGDKPKKNGFKKRIDKLTKRNSEYEARIAQLEAQLNKPKEDAKPQDVKVEDLKEPDINDYEHYKDYVKDLAKFEINQEKQKLILKEQEDLTNKEAQKIIDKYNERLAEAKNRYGEDKWEKLSKIDLPLSTQMRAEIMQSEIGPDVLFYLLHNAEETKRIYKLTAAQQVKELTKIELKVEQKLKGNNKPDPKTSKAPNPVNPISNSKAQGNGMKKPEEMSFKEYKAWRASKQN